MNSSSSSSSSSLYESAPVGWHSVTSYDYHHHHQQQQQHTTTTTTTSNMINIIDGSSNNDSGNNDNDNNSIVYIHKRIFNERDFQLKFISREEFSGFKVGFVFRLGAQGLGYYEDTAPATI